MKFTTENQSEYDDNFLPTLDFKLKLEDVGDTKVIRYHFSKNPISSSLGILKTSALSETIISATAAQEIIGRLSNTRKEETQEVKNKTLEDYLTTL